MADSPGPSETSVTAQGMVNMSLENSDGSDGTPLAVKMLMEAYEHVMVHSEEHDLASLERCNQIFRGAMLVANVAPDFIQRLNADLMMVLEHQYVHTSSYDILSEACAVASKLISQAYHDDAIDGKPGMTYRTIHTLINHAYEAGSGPSSINGVRSYADGSHVSLPAKGDASTPLFQGFVNAAEKVCSQINKIPNDQQAEFLQELSEIWVHLGRLADNDQWKDYGLNAKRQSVSCVLPGDPAISEYLMSLYDAIWFGDFDKTPTSY